MAFTFSPARALTAEEVNPFSNLISNALKQYTQGIQASYLKPSIEEQLQNARLVNQYYGPNIESQIGLRGAQTKETGARTGLLGQQAIGQQINNQYLPEALKAQIEQAKAQAQQAQLVQALRERLLGNNRSSHQEGGNSYSPGQGNPLFREQENSSSLGTNDYGAASLGSQLLGLGKPQIIDVNGRQVALTPFGAIDTGIQGLTEKEKVLAKEDAKKVSNLEDIVLSSSQKADTLNSLNSDLGSSAFEEIRRHPVLGRHEISWFEKFGTPEQQKIIGRLKTNMGNIIKDSARDFAGQFRIGEQALLNDMKPNIGDSLDVMKGKAEALTFLNTIMSKRAELEANYIRSYNLTPLQAKLAADREINPKEIKKEIKSVLYRNQITPDEAKAELERRRANRSKNG